MIKDGALDRARGCLLGQLAGDSLGSLVEFWGPTEIRRRYPEGVRDLADGGTWDTIAGQPTDDSEMALTLARTLLREGRYDQDAARAAYLRWYDSHPFDVGTTTTAAMLGSPNEGSQANGSLMRISPLGIFAAGGSAADAAAWARADAAITHPHPVCGDTAALYTMAIARAIADAPSPTELYEAILRWAREESMAPSLVSAAEAAEEAPPKDYTDHAGWLLIAFRNALYQLLHAPDLESGVIDTVMHGGDTDTNAAICGALLGAVHGMTAVPERWRDVVLACRPEAGAPGVHRPRPAEYWPVDALELAEGLLRKHPS